MKYVIGYNDSTGYHHPIVFDEHIVHAHVAAVLHLNKCKIMSAGFVNLHNGVWGVSSRKSKSLNLGPSPNDEFILNQFLIENLSGLNLANAVIYREIQKRKGK